MQSTQRRVGMAQLFCLLSLPGIDREGTNDGKFDVSPVTERCTIETACVTSKYILHGFQFVS
jgi:hypothetical protein